MYYCNDCKIKFKKAHVTLTPWGSLYKCPMCHSTSYKELEYEELKHSQKTFKQNIYDIKKKLGTI